MNRKLIYLAAIALVFFASCGEQAQPTDAVVSSTDSTLTDEQLIQEIDKILSSTERIRMKLDMVVQENANTAQ
jgi:hypothetical protein